MKGRAIFERNVDACESAKHPKCVCPCGGALHGSKHSRKWRRETWGKIESEREAERRELKENGELELLHAGGES